MTSTPEPLQSPAFAFGMHCELVIANYRNATLSVPALAHGETLETKELLQWGDIPDDGKYTLESHLAHLANRMSINSGRPVVLLGARNNLVNFRCPISLDGSVYGVKGEEPLQSRRPYYGIGYSNGKFSCDTLLAGGSEPCLWDFFCAGVPVLWDDWDDERLFSVMLCEAADQSHLFELPRGNHPEATDQSRKTWQTLHHVFVQHLHDDYESTASALHLALRALRPHPRLCHTYFHSVVGVNRSNHLFCLFAHGSLLTLGKLLRQRGCFRAVCLENSGSVMPTYIPPKNRSVPIPLCRAPNFRNKGRALIYIELANAAFSPISFTDSSISDDQP